MSEPTTLLWLDLETTGLDRTKDYILEVACFATAPDLSFLGYERTWVLKPNNENFLEQMDDFVVEMHMANGLLVDSRNHGISPDDFIVDFKAYLEELRRELKHDKVTMAGSGVGPFDLPFLLHDFPELTEYFTYYVMDVGVVGRFLRNVVGKELPERPTVAHRAMADLEDHLNELLEYVDLCR